VERTAYIVVTQNVRTTGNGDKSNNVNHAIRIIDTMNVQNDEPTPCPNCEYDLRGHPDRTRCLECGQEVHISALLASAQHWLDNRMLDLWAIGWLMGVGAVSAVTCYVSIVAGLYMALLLGLVACMYLIVALLWLIGTAVSTVQHRNYLKVIRSARVRKFNRTFYAECFVIVVILASMIMAL